MVEEGEALASRLSRRLKKRSWTISIAEYCTGGLIASMITNISGSSSWFKQGWIVYSNDSKMRELGVEPKAFDQGESGAVSHKVAVQMARGARYKSRSNVAIAVTGIAGPGGDEDGKEIGRVHVAVMAEDYFIVRRMDFGENDRVENKKSFAAFALRLALEAIDKVDESELKSKESLSFENEEIDESKNLDPGSKEWEGSISWGKEQSTVAESLKKIDLASLIDWDEN